MAPRLLPINIPKKMKGVILAGGLGTRLRPLTEVTNKHLLPIYDQPMIFYPINTLVKAGVTEIMIVVGGPHAGHFIPVLKNGKDLGVKHLEYAFQEKEGGIAQALSLAEDFADGDSLAVILADNTTDADIRSEVTAFQEGALVFLKEVLDPQRFGVPVFEGGRIVDIEEKPINPKSGFAVTGVYLFDRTIFDKIRLLKPSERGEYEITEVNNMYIKENKLKWTQLNGFWTDAGTFETLLKANRYWGERANTGGKEKGY